MAKFYGKNTSKWILGKSRKRGRPRKRDRRIVRIISILSLLLLGGVVIGVITVFGVIAFFSKDLPSPDKLSVREVPQSTKIFSNDGVLLYEIFGDERRTLVVLDDVPEYLKQATIAVEDKSFYTHRGFDIFGMARGAYNTLIGEGLQGGSTITQQVVKNTLLSPERTITRKIKEAILSIQLERLYTKDEILQMYFNESPYGGQAWGVGAAAEMYFGKHVRDLTLAEATLIAGLPQSPTFYSPCGTYPENAKVRQEMVLNLMVENGYITQEQKEEVLNTEDDVICYGYSASDIKAPHFVMYVKSQLTDLFGEKMVEQGGLRVTTTLDWKQQQITEEEVQKQIDALAAANANASNAGVVLVDPNNGYLKAMVGSVDYFDTEHDGNVNVTLSERQPGSSIKPLTYLTAFRLGYTPSTFVSDIGTCFPGGAGSPDYCPVNWDDKFWGPMSIRTALANSRNIPAVKMLQVVGLQNMVDLAHDLGITSLNEPERYGLSLTLGGGEVRPIDMAQAYAVIANMGEMNPLTPILKVEDAQGNVLHEYKKASRDIVKEEYTYLINDVLSDSSARQATFGNSMEIGRKIATKTGTTNDNRDAWTIGYTPQYVSVVWVGNFNNEAMNGIQGSTGATPIMKGVMRRVHEGLDEAEWPQPENVVNRQVDKLSGLIPQEGKDFPTVFEKFAKGTVPKEVDDFHITVRVCQSDPLKLATEYHEDNDLAEDRTFIYLKELSSDWQQYTNQWMQQRRDEGYGNPPEEKCAITIDGEQIEGPLIEITTPADGDLIKARKFEVAANVYTDDRVTQVKFYWDDEEINTVTSAPYKTTYNLNKLDEEMRGLGLHTIRVSATDPLGNESNTSIEINLVDSSSTNNSGDNDSVTPTNSAVSPTPTPEDNGGVNLPDLVPVN